VVRFISSLSMECHMRNEERIYEAPRLVERGDAVVATRIRSTLPHEPSGAPLQGIAGDVGFGL
jgi:hypothetical protein